MQDYEQKQGLYDPSYEHDACGIGAIAQIKGIKTHKTIKDALDILIHLEHRGGTGAEDNSGDGAGIFLCHIRRLPGGVRAAGAVQRHVALRAGGRHEPLAGDCEIPEPR